MFYLFVSTRPKIKDLLGIIIVVLLFILSGCSLLEVPDEQVNEPQAFDLTVENVAYYLSITYTTEAQASPTNPVIYHYTIEKANNHFIFMDARLNLLWRDNEEIIDLDEDGFASFFTYDPITITSVEGRIQYESYLDMNNPSLQEELTLENYRDYFVLEVYSKSIGIERIAYFYEIKGSLYQGLYVDVTIHYLDEDNEEQILQLNAGGVGKFNFVNHQLNQNTDIIAIEGMIYFFNE